MMQRLFVVWKHIRMLMHSCTLSQEEMAPYRAGGMEVNKVGYPTAVRDGVLSGSHAGWMARVFP